MKNSPSTILVSKSAYVAVLDSRGERIPGLFLRGGRYYAKAQIDRKLHIRSLKTGHLAEALPRCRAFLKDVRGRHWKAVEASRSQRKKAMPAVGQLVIIYRKAAGRRSSPRPYVVENNIRALLRIAHAMQPADALKPDLLDEFALRMQAGTAPGTPERDSRDRSIASLIRGARSVFAQRADFRNVALPDGLKAFLEYSPVQAKLPPNLQPPREVAERTIAAGRALTGDLAAVWALCFDLGLRSSEAAAARWGWLETMVPHPTDLTQKTDPALGTPMTFMVIRDRPEEGFQAKSSRCRVTCERRVPVPHLVSHALHECRSTAEAFFMPTATVQARAAFITRDFCRWLRSVDPWWGEHKLKAAHALRGLRGAFWMAKYGAPWAMTWLGHANFQTTLNHYSRPLDYAEQQALDDDPWLRARRICAAG